MSIEAIGPGTPVTQVRRAGVDLSGLMSVLSKHLYSTPMVALRELVQNAHDSIVRRRLEQPGWTGVSRIDISGDRTDNTLRIVDTGAGLTEDEIHAYLATVGVGYTRKLRESEQEDSGLIGMFGLGFLSAFVLAKHVSVRTTSYQEPDLGHCYASINAEQYSVESIPRRPIGTEIVLKLHDEFSALTSAQKLREILEHYCALLAEPIHIGGGDALNPEPPPWRQADAVELHPIQARRRDLAFAAKFERSFEPICTLPLRPDADSDAVGLLWVQDGSTYGSSDNRNLSVFLRGMLLDDDARDLLPSWAGFVGGVIESKRMTPTASREDLQRDAHYRATKHAITEALIEGLTTIARDQPETWRRIVARHNEALLGASLCDDRLFAMLMDNVRIPTSQGDLPARELQSNGAVHIILEDRQGFEEMLFRAMGVPVARGNRYAVVPFLRRWASAKGLRLVELGTEQGNRQLFRLADLPEADTAWLERHLADGEKLVPAHFQPVALPLIVVPDRDTALKKRLDEDADDRKISLSALRLARKFTASIDSSHDHRLYVNLDNPAVARLLRAIRAEEPNAAVAARLLKAFKNILDGQSAHAPSTLNRALVDLAASVERLIDATAPSHSPTQNQDPTP